MSIDGIGGGGRRPLGGVPEGVQPKTTAAVSANPRAASTGSANGAAPSAALEQLSRGEISVGQYLDARVTEAVKHLEGRLPAAELDFVKQTLRAELSTDPVLVELLRRTTGSAPALDSE